MILEIRQRLVEQSSESLTQLLDLMLPPTVLARMLAGTGVGSADVHDPQFRYRWIHSMVSNEGLERGGPNADCDR
jgi:hypothetical protein